MNEDEDNLSATNTSGEYLCSAHRRRIIVRRSLDVLPLLSGMIQTYNQGDHRLYGFTFVELVDGLSKLMVHGRTHKYIDKNLVNILLNILEHASEDDTLFECVSNAILNASFDDQVQSLLDSEHALDIIKSTGSLARSPLVRKNCDAILWTLNRIPHKHCSTLNQSCELQGHIMISYNRSVTAMCLKIRDRLKVTVRSHVSNAIMFIAH